MYQFNWDRFTENNFKTAVHWAFSDMFDWYVGAARVGDLCFDFVLRALDGEDEPIRLNYDLYIGGVDDGYSEKDGYPYTYGDGGAFDIKWYDMSYDEFKKHAEEQMTAYINENSASLFNLIEKASEPLHIW